MSIKTKFGTISLDNKGYYRISSSKEGNRGKLFHRLIYEDFWGVKLPPKIVVHHKNRNKLDNCILNLEAMSNEEHMSLHSKGNQYCAGRELSEETRKKISVSHDGKRHSLESRKLMSINKNTTGYFNVCKNKGSFRYRYYDNEGNRKDIWAKDIKNLEKKVKAKGLHWLKFDKKLNGGYANDTSRNFN